MYDAIVVGARCAGSSLAMLLARGGRRVLVVDKDRLASDKLQSTHMIWCGGVDLLSQWGLLDRLKATGCKGASKLTLDLGEFSLVGQSPPSNGIDEAFAPRRFELDSLLSTAAVEAGAEYRYDCTVLGVLEQGGRVIGIRYRDAEGVEHEERAAVVVGADGQNSTIARAVGAASYNEEPPLGGTIWAYFRDLPLDGMEFSSRPGRMCYAWSTNDDLTVLGICFPRDEFVQLAKSRDDVMLTELDEHGPRFSERLLIAERTTEWFAGSIPSTCRKPVGPGWALLGDAGITMDPITAAGITNALRDASVMANGMLAGLNDGVPVETALAEFEDQRNAASMPLYHFSSEMAKLAPPPQEIIDLFVALHGNQADTDAYFGVFGQTVSVEQFFSPDNVARILAAAEQRAV